MITLKVLCKYFVFVIINTYDTYNGTYNLNIFNIIYKPLERRHQAATYEKDIDHCIRYVIQFPKILCKCVIINLDFFCNLFHNDHSWVITLLF